MMRIMLVVLKVLNLILRNSTFLFCIINDNIRICDILPAWGLFHDLYSLPLNPPFQVLGFIVWYFVAVASRRPSVSVCAFILLFHYWRSSFNMHW